MASHDAAWKRLFSFTDMPRDLLAGFVPRKWVEKLDLSTLEPLPPVLPIVLHHGTKRWWAREDVAGLCAPTGENLAPYQPAQRYFLLDMATYTDSLPEGRNLMAALIRIVHCRSVETVLEVLKMLAGRMSSPDQTGLLGAFLVWYEQARRRYDLPKLDLSILDDLNEGKTMPNEIMREQVARWTEQRLAEWAAPRMERSRVEGRAEGRTEVMRRLAARKFGPETADRLAGRLAKISDPERLGEVGEWLLECDSGEELLDRVARLCETAATEDHASQE